MNEIWWSQLLLIVLQEEAKRKALGLPASGVPIDEEDYDPFAKPGSRAGGVGEEDEEGGGGDKAAMSWSYSKYMKAFDQEEVMNDVDLETFSTLTGEGRCSDIFS